MKNYTGLLLTVTILGILFIQSSCNQTTADTYPIPTTYNFDNVNYDGQTKRIQMLTELSNYAKSANSLNASSLSATSLINMYTNTNSPFSKSELNSSGKQLKNKMVQSEQNKFETYLTALATASQHTNQTASQGQAGIMTSNDGSKRYLLNENGMELAQLIEKGIATACFYYQATAVYLGETKMNVDNKAVIAGKGTNMEHHWDESFGYLGAPIDFPGNINNLELWAKYSNKVNSVLGCNSKIMNAYLKGRAAVSAKDYDTRDIMRGNIKAEWEVILAAVAISYLNDAKAVSTDKALYCHYITEAYAFIMGLKYGASKSLPDFEVDHILADLAGSSNPLLANLYQTTTQDIDKTISAITDKFTQLAPVKADL